MKKLLCSLALFVSLSASILADDGSDLIYGYRLYRTQDGGYGYDKEGKYFFWHRTPDGIWGYDPHGRYFELPNPDSPKPGQILPP
jgi:hypothetical protein